METKLDYSALANLSLASKETFLAWKEQLIALQRPVMLNLWLRNTSRQKFNDFLVQYEDKLRIGNKSLPLYVEKETVSLELTIGGKLNNHVRLSFPTRKGWEGVYLSDNEAYAFMLFSFDPKTPRCLSMTFTAPINVAT